LNTKEYIESGILELYVAGMLSEAESQDVTRNAQTYPEIRAEIEAIESALGQYMLAATAEKPDPSILARALQQIDDSSQHSGFTPPNTGPISPQSSQITSGSYIPVWSWAAVILLLISIVGNIVLYQNWQQSETAVIELIQANEELESSLEQREAVLAVYEGENFQEVDLAGQEIAPEASARVYWNPTSSEVFLKVLNLPQPDSDQQYQLWAIQDGQPIDAGVFDLQGGLIALKNISGETGAFAITLEPRGGSESPTLENLYVIGNPTG